MEFKKKYMVKEYNKFPFYWFDQSDPWKNNKKPLVMEWQSYSYFAIRIWGANGGLIRRLNA